MIFELADDFREAVEHMPREHKRHRMLELLERAMRRDIHFIHQHREDYPQALFQQVYNHAGWYDHPDAEKHYVKPDDGWNEANAPWLRPGAKLHEALDRWRQWKQDTEPGFTWACSQRPPATPLGSALRAVLQGHEGNVTTVAYSPDGRRIVSGSWDRTVRVWDAQTGQPTAVLKGHERVVSSVAFDGRRIVSGSEDNTVRVWDAQTGENTAVLQGHVSYVNSVAFSPDGRRIVSGAFDYTVRVWDSPTPKTMPPAAFYTW